VTLRIIEDDLIGVARARGYARVSLETGAPDQFAPAHRLDLANGFADCPEDPFSRFMTRAL